MQPAFSPDEIDQLQRAAQMFEMILDSGAPSDEAYETLKDVYDKLRMPDEYRRVVARFADFLLARDDRDAGIAQLIELAQRYPDETEWRDRLSELGVSPPVSDQAPATDEASAATDEASAATDEASAATDEASAATDEASAATDEAPAAEEAAAVQEEAPGEEEAPSREAIEAFNELKETAEEQAAEVIRDAEGEDLDRAIGEAEQILSELDAGAVDGAERDVETGENGAQPESATQEVGATEEVGAAEELGTAEEGSAADDGAAAEQPAAAGEETPQAEGAAPVARASAQHVVARPHAHVTGSIEKEYQKSLRLGEMLVEQGVITRDNLETALDKQHGSGRRIGQILIELGYATEEDVLNCLALQAGVPYLPLALYEVQPEVAALLPGEFAQRHCVLPVDVIANSVLVTIAAPLSPEVRAELEALLGEHKANYYISEQSIIEQKLGELYPRSAPKRPARGEA